jgi:hypothetical protein
METQNYVPKLTRARRKGGSWHDQTNALTSTQCTYRYSDKDGQQAATCRGPVSASYNMLTSVYKLSVAKARPLTGRSGVSATERFVSGRKARQLPFYSEFSTIDWCAGRMAAESLRIVPSSPGFIDSSPVCAYSELTKAARIGGFFDFLREDWCCHASVKRGAWSNCSNRA